MKRRREDYFGPARGWKGFMHRLVMGLLYPFRKPLIFIPILIGLYLVPTFIGAKPAEVHLWYWAKAQKVYNDSAEFVKTYSKDWFSASDENIMPEMGGTVLPEKGTDQLVNMRQKANRRQVFEKANSALQVVDILETEEVVAPLSTPPSVEPVTTEIATAPVVEIDSGNKPKEIALEKKLPLVYVKEVKSIVGNAIVHNANEIVVDGTYIFLYGIYVDPNLPKGIEAKRFLEQFIKDKTVRCDIVAYTYQNIATGLCFVDDDNINQTLVEENFSRNVAL